MTSMLFPMAAMVLMTLVIAFYMAKVRFTAIKSGETTDLSYFKTFQGASTEPENVQKVQRNYHNLLGTPMLFYAACAAALALGIADTVLLYMAWAYVGLRVIHSYVHITSNVVTLRFRIFALSMFMLTAIWVRLMMVAT